MMMMMMSADHFVSNESTFSLIEKNRCADFNHFTLMKIGKF